MQTLRRSLRAALALLAAAGCARGAPAPEPAPRPAPLQLFLLAGQSNMAGRGVVEAADRAEHPRVAMLDRDGRWRPAAEPMHFDKPIAGVGPGRSFGLALAAADTTLRVGLIPAAVGGSAITAWEPGGVHAETGAHPYDDAIRRARLAMRDGELKAILWHQGESDANPRSAPEYAARLRALVERFRADLGDPALPVLVGQLGRFEGRPWTPSHLQVDAAHRELARTLPNVAYVPAEGLGHKGDTLHFSAAAARELGRRYAEAYRALARPAAAAEAPPAAGAARVAIVHDDSVPQAAYAARRLAEALRERGYQVTRERTGYDRLVSLAVHRERLGPEAFSILPEGRVVTVYGGDERGMIYGTLALAEALRNGTPLEEVRAESRRPSQEFRAIKFNLPWETYRPSSALDQHRETARDPKFWEAFLDMMVENRFNAVTLWNLNPFTFMVRPRNFPEASPWSEAEMAEWRHLYREIFRMAEERGLDSYIVHWSIFVSREFAEAHGVAKQNFYPHYYVPGDTSEIVRRYVRESVTQVLREYPDLDGIGISHGEGMAGMTPLQRQRWMDDVIIAGMLDAGRPVKLIHRVPFSSGTSSDPGVSRNVEEVTRAAMERLGSRFEGPIWVEVKFNWSHAHSTPKLVKVHGGPLGDTYFSPPPGNYKITWQARNEDFFALRWGVPDFIRRHVALNGAADYVGGYFVGSETYIPALDYFTAVREPVDWRWAFQRQWLFYKLWGRLLYDPATPDSVFQAEFNRRYGRRGDGLLRAYSLASSTQLRLASLYDSRWDFTLYSEGFLALQGDTTKYISVDRLIEQPTMDPDYVSVGDYVKRVREGGSFAAGRVTPPALADLLERDNREALRLVEGIDVSGNASLMYEVADVKAWAHLGLHLAEKLRGAVALQTYRLAGGEASRRAAVEHLQRALGHWDDLVRLTRPIYRDMPLTHYNHNFFGANDDNLFHWALVRGEVARDVEIARSAAAPGR